MFAISVELALIKSINPVFFTSSLTQDSHSSFFIIINHHEYISTSKLHEIDSADSIYHRVGRDFVFEVTGIGNDTCIRASFSINDEFSYEYQRFFYLYYDDSNSSVVGIRF